MLLRKSLNGKGRGSCFARVCCWLELQSAGSSSYREVTAAWPSFMELLACHSSGSENVGRIDEKAETETLGKRCTLDETGCCWKGWDHWLRCMMVGQWVRLCYQRWTYQAERVFGSWIEASCRTSCESRHAARLCTTQGRNCCSPKAVNWYAILGGSRPTESQICSSFRRMKQPCSPDVQHKW